MSKQLLTEMAYDEFQTLMNDYITRSAGRDDAVPASNLLELLFALLVQRASNVDQLEGQIVDGELVLAPIAEASPVQVQGNRILLGDVQVVVTLKNNAPLPVVNYRVVL